MLALLLLFIVTLFLLLSSLVLLSLVIRYAYTFNEMEPNEVGNDDVFVLKYTCLL